LAIKIAKRWPMLASALNDSLGWGAEWKVGEWRIACIYGVALHVSIRTAVTARSTGAQAR
jgi:hypothetical protein